MSFNIITGKEGASPKKPLFLVTVTAPDGDVCYLTTAAYYGAPSIVYSGNTYLARIQSNSFGAFQAMSPQGYDSMPGFTMTLADGDKFLWTNHCVPHGWGGSSVLLTVILWDVVANAYSTDSLQWTFIGGNPQYTTATGLLSFEATNAVNFTRLKVPSVPLQYRCPWDFPATSAQRAAALNDPTSVYYQCGYSADQSGGIGNYESGSTCFTTCDYTRSSPSDPSVGCMARLGNGATTSVAPDGDLLHDKAGHTTGRFGGVTWLAPVEFSGRQYVSSQKVYGFNQPNTALPGSYYTLLYGTQWVDCQVLAPAADPNSLRSECAVCVALWGAAQIQKVLVNGVEIPYYTTSTDSLFMWQFVNAGGRTGNLNGNAIYSVAPPTPGPYYSAMGDPHGSVCVILVVVPEELAAGGSIPSVQALVTGPPILTLLDSGGTVGFVSPNLVDASRAVAGPAANPVWAYLDLMAWGNIQLTQIEPASWYNTAQICATSISYTAADGSTQTHAQFKASFALEGNSRQALSQAMTALRNSANLMVAPNSVTGLIQCFIKLTLADQQPSAIAGSNDSSPHASVTAAGASANGYYAYNFDETNIEKDSFQVTTTRIASTPNTFGFTFQDEYNGYQQDSLTEIDPQAYLYSGNQEVAVPIPVNAIPNFDQGTRIGNVQLAEALYGNPRNDQGGTLYFEFSTNQRVLHLVSRLGYICGLTWQSLGIGISSPQPVRLLSVTPDTDGEHWKIKAAWHQDDWYTIAYGQNPSPFQTNPLLSPPARPPYPYRPGAAAGSGGTGGTGGSAWTSGDALFPGLYSFACSLDLSSYPAEISVTGSVPCNTQPSTLAPLVPLQASSATTGGTLKPGNYLVKLSCNGTQGPVSNSISVVIPAGTNTNRIVISGVEWRSGAAPSIAIYVGSSSLTMYTPLTASFTSSSPDSYGNPTAFSIDGFDPDGFGLPDTVFSEFVLEQQVIEHGGAWGDAVGPVSSGTGTQTLTFPAGAWSTNQWVGHILSLYYRPLTGGGSLDSSAAQPMLNLVVASSTANTVTVTGSGFQVADIVVMRFKSASITANTIGDPNCVNSYAPSGLTVNGETGNLIYIIAGTGARQALKTINSNTATVFTIAGKWDTTPDATSVFVVLAPLELELSYTKPIHGLGSTRTFIGNLPVYNTKAQSLMVTVATADTDGNTSPWQYQPKREVYVPGQSTTGNAGAFTVLSIVSSNVTIDLSLGTAFKLTLNQSTPVTILVPIKTGGTVAAPDDFSLYIFQDSTGYRPNPVFTTGAGGFGADVINLPSGGGVRSLDGTPGTFSPYQLTMHDDGLFHLDSWGTGQPY